MFFIFKRKKETVDWLGYQRNNINFAARN